jgi:stearoyl-CoA desaturase (delta-9 desaturase)
VNSTSPPGPGAVPRIGGRPITIRSAPLQRALRIHGLAVLIVPAVGTLVTVVTIPLLGVTWLDLAALATMYVICMFGVTVGLHRHLEHRSFTAPPAVRAALAIAGSMALQGPPTYWVATHRRHHRFADRPGDPHSPAPDVASGSAWRRFWHAHVGWTLEHELTNTTVFARDLIADARMRWINRRYCTWLASSLLLPTLFAGLVGRSWRAALGGLLWGGFVRAFLAYHATMSINSVAHLTGSRPHQTSDTSRNVAWLALPTCGESWHNNHHAGPARPSFTDRPWQVDIGGLTVRALMAARLAGEVPRAGRTIREGPRHPDPDGLDLRAHPSRVPDDERVGREP